MRGVLRAVTGRVQRAHDDIAELELPAVVERSVNVLGLGQTMDVIVAPVATASRPWPET